MSIGIIGIDPTSVTTTAGFALGVRGAVEDQAAGVREYVYVSFPVSTARVIGDVVQINSDGSTVGCTTTTAGAGSTSGRRVGVVTGTVASSTSLQYGWVQVYGLSAVSVLASCVRNTLLYTTATAGALDDTATTAVTGIVINVTATGAAVTAATLNYPQVAV